MKPVDCKRFVAELIPTVGAHLPASMRAACVHSFIGLITAGTPFEMAAKAVCLSMVGTQPR